MASKTVIKPIIGGQVFTAPVAAALKGAVLHPAVPTLAAAPLVTNAILAAKATQTAAAQAAVSAGGAPIVAPAPNVSIQDLLDIENDLYVDPVFCLKRHFRSYVLPLTVDANGNLLGTPQHDCIPWRFFIPKGSAATKTIRQLQSGVDQYYATADSVDAGLYGNGVAAIEAAYLRPILTTVGKKIEATTTLANTTRCGMFCFDISDDGVLTPPYNRPMMMGTSAVLLTHGGVSTTVDLFPQKSFRLRHLSINDTVANWNDTIDGTHGVSLTNILIGNEPQSIDSQPLPADMFGLSVLGGMFDGDWAKVGKKATVVLQNNEAANDITTSVSWWGDTLDD